MMKKYIRVQLPESLLKVIDKIRSTAPRSDIVNYFLTWYIEENFETKLHLMEKEKQEIRKLLAQARKES